MGHPHKGTKATLFLNKPFQPKIMGPATNTGLPSDWAYSPSIDLETKHYILLGYAQRVQARFKEHKLYPYLADLRIRTDELLRLQQDKELFARSMRTTLIGFDPNTGGPVREVPEQPEPLQVIDQVIDLAIPKLKQLLRRGIGLRSELVQQVRFTPVGLQPLHATEGWLLLRRGKEARVYAYSIPFLLEQDEEQLHRSVFTRYVTTYTLGLTRTFERIKSELIDEHPHLPNPATFAVETDTALPCIETLVPLAKHLVHAHVLGLSQSTR